MFDSFCFGFTFLGRPSTYNAPDIDYYNEGHGDPNYTNQYWNKDSKSTIKRMFGNFCFTRCESPGVRREKFGQNFLTETWECFQVLTVTVTVSSSLVGGGNEVIASIVESYPKHFTEPSTNSISTYYV